MEGFVLGEGAEGVRSVQGRRQVGEGGRLLEIRVSKMISCYMTIDGRVVIGQDS